MRTLTGVGALTAAAAVVVASLSLAAGPAGAATELITIPIDRVVRGAPGDEILVASADLPPDLVGLTCDMFGETDNQESVHLGNDLLIVVGDQTRVIANFEDERDIVHPFRLIEQLPERIDVYVRLGPDGVSSGGFLISIECPAPPPASSSTSSSPPSTSSSSIPASTTTPSTVDTTTSALPATSSTGAPTVSLPEIDLQPLPSVSVLSNVEGNVEGPPQLAVTGRSSGGLVGVGLALVALGAMVGFAGSRLRRLPR